MPLFIQKDLSAIPRQSATNGHYIPRSIVQRSYTCYTYKDTLIMCHPNGLVVSRISPLHIAFDSNHRDVLSFSFAQVKQRKLEEMEVSGKSKRGSIRVKANTVIGAVICSDGSSYDIVAGIEGDILEVNRKLEKDSLNSDAGFLVIIKPHSDLIEQALYNLFE